MIYEIEVALATIKEQKPLILCLTNHVTMEFMANCLLAIGAVPLMSCDASEFEELINISDAININLGTLDSGFIERCHVAIKLANQYNKPVIIDPVGAGASMLRTNTARVMIPSADIVRGNASEIMALTDDNIRTKGVESNNVTEDAFVHAKTIAHSLNNTIVISGKQDFVTTKNDQMVLTGGSPLMAHVSGMGCTLTAIIAAFRACIEDSFCAAILATTFFSYCGMLAESNEKHPGNFKSQFIDELHAANISAMKNLKPIE